MITLYKENQHGRSNLGWLTSWFHFSFAEYCNPKRMQFGALRVINDDIIQADTGFGTHPHRDMEIISYIVEGELTHGDSMGNQRTLSRGQIQYMSAGKGITHSEYNNSAQTTRILQIWILPDQKGYQPRYGDYSFAWEEREDKWLHLVSGEMGNAPVKIHQDANFYALSLSQGKTISFEVQKDRLAYLVLIEGSALINNHLLETRDGLETIEESLTIEAKETTHLLLIELAKN
jgi:quercetin 2,3-dioxygenase